MRFERVATFLMAVSLAACAAPPTPLVTLTAAPTIGPTVDLTYEPAPGTVVLYADIQPIPGAPANLVACLYETVPRLRVWGDGLVFLDVSKYGVSGPPLWTGHLSPAQMQDVVTYLSNQGFMDNWTPSAADGPNPAGTSISLGVHLKRRSIQRGSGNTDWPFYGALVKRLLPKLTPLSVQSSTDTRITSLNIGSRECITATAPATPDFAATQSALKTPPPLGYPMLASPSPGPSAAYP